MSVNNQARTLDNLNPDVRLILEEITRFLNMEKLLPSYRHTITVRYDEDFFPKHTFKETWGRFHLSFLNFFLLCANPDVDILILHGIIFNNILTIVNKSPKAESWSRDLIGS